MWGNRTKPGSAWMRTRSEEHTSELQSQSNLVCRLLLEKKKYNMYTRVSVGSEYDDRTNCYNILSVDVWFNYDRQKEMFLQLIMVAAHEVNKFNSVCV